jgi:hypothetical protein
MILWILCKSKESRKDFICKNKLSRTEGLKSGKGIQKEAFVVVSEGKKYVQNKI